MRGKSAVRSMLALFVCLAATQVADANPGGCEGGDLGFEIEKSGIWRVAPGERLAPIARLKKPGLYEVCRAGAIHYKPVRIAKGGSLQVSMEFPANSCALVHSASIDVVVDEKVERTELVLGTYRRIGERDDPVFTDLSNFQFQADFVQASDEHRYLLSLLGLEGKEMTFRVCQGWPHGDHLPAGVLYGIQYNVDGAPLRQHPLGPESAVIGAGSCVDVAGKEIFLAASNASQRDVSVHKTCGKFAYGYAD